MPSDYKGTPSGIVTPAMSSDNEGTSSGDLTPDMFDCDEEMPSGMTISVVPDYFKEMPSFELPLIISIESIKYMFDRRELYIGHVMYYRSRCQQIVDRINAGLCKHMGKGRCDCKNRKHEFDNVIDAVIQSSKCTRIKGVETLNFAFESEKHCVGGEGGCPVSVEILLEKHKFKVRVRVSKLEGTDKGFNSEDGNKDKSEDEDEDKELYTDWSQEWTEDYKDIESVTRATLDIAKETRRP